MRNVKALGLMLVAVVAMSAIAASAAQATTSFHSEEEITRLEGVQVTQNKIAIDGGNVTCSSVIYHATTTAKTVTTVTVTPTLSGCLFAGRSATIDVNECDYLLHLVDKSSPVTAIGDLICPAGKEITVTVPSVECTVHIEAAQNSLAHVTFSNGGAGTTRDITATLNVTGVKYTETKPCPGIGAGTTTNNGQLTGTVTIKGFKDVAGGAQVGIWAE